MGTKQGHGFEIFMDGSRNSA